MTVSCPKAPRWFCELAHISLKNRKLLDKYLLIK